MSFSEFLALLAVPPGSLSYHLISLVALEAGLGLAWSRYQEGRARSDRMAVWGFAGALALQFGPLLMAALGVDETARVMGALSTLIAGMLVWGMALHPFRPLMVRYAPAALGMGVLGLALLWPDQSISLWAVLTSLMFCLGAAVATWQRNPASWPSLLLAFILLGLAPLIPLFTPDSPSAIGAGRLVTLSGYLVLIVALYRRTAAGWQEERVALDSELQSLSRNSLQQTQERLFLLQVSQTVSASLNLRQVLDTAAESLALGGQVDRAIIALVDETDAKRMWVVAGYAPLERQVWQTSQIHFQLQNFPTVQAAATRQEPVVLQRQTPSGEVVALHALLGSVRIGPLLIQPLIHQDTLVGLVLLSNVASGRDFTEQDQKFCSALSGQITSAIANARLYERVTRLLLERDADASQRQAILESITDGVIATDQEGTIILVNAAVGRILHRETKALLGRPLAAVCPRLWMDGAPGQRAFELRERIIRGHVASVKRPGGKKLGFVAVLRDVTQETQSERAKSRFIATVSHELRTPMTAIKGYTDLMAAGMGGELAQAQREFINIIQANTERMVGIVNNMITVSEMEGEIDFTPEPMDMGPLLQRAIQIIEPELKRRELKFNFYSPTEIPPVMGDPLRLRQVVDNLLSNACKFTPPGGRVGVNVKVLPAGAFSPDDAGYLVVEVSDTGVGIPPEERTRIFESFYRADNPRSVQAGGAGVGLTIAKDLIERHGGRIWVDSKMGSGSIFTFIIPLAR